MEKELTKNLLRNKTCDNCYARRLTIRAIDPKWCLAKSCRPKENTCELWAPNTMRPKPPEIYYAT